MRATHVGRIRRAVPDAHPAVLPVPRAVIRGSSGYAPPNNSAERTHLLGGANPPYDLRFGTFRPFLRASERPIAIACLRLVTFFPLRPLRSVPRLRLRIARATSLEALREYRRAILLFPWIVFSHACCIPDCVIAYAPCLAPRRACERDHEIRGGTSRFPDCDRAGRFPRGQYGARDRNPGYGRSRATRPASRAARLPS